MIVGIGIDLVEIERIGALLARQSAKQRAKLFTSRELRLAGSGRRSAETLAARFAAKEAAMKALGAGVGQGVAYHEIEVVRERSGAPRLVLHGGAKAVALARGAKRFHVSLSHTATHATAVVVLER